MFVLHQPALITRRMKKVPMQFNINLKLKSISFFSQINFISALVKHILSTLNIFERDPNKSHNYIIEYTYLKIEDKIRNKTKLLLFLFPNVVY